MRFFILIASLWALVAAKPEFYKEKEDFQYSRSSSDDGTKSGYYGAQRGNMGGNFERAHNMDTLAQHQMSTLVRNVDGELGEGANTRTGNVFAAANSRGLYGSGNYDLSNLRGRNFGDSMISSDSLSQSATSKNSGYSDYSRYGNSYSASNNNQQYSSNQAQSSGFNSGYRSSDLASQYSQTDAQNAADSIHGTRNYKYDRQGTTNSNNYNYAQGSTQAQSDYENSNSASTYDQKTRTNLIHTTPVRVYISPGTRIAIPVAAQVYDENAIDGLSTVHSNSKLDTAGQRLYYRPSNNAKHYESSYSYRKEWQKQDTIPVTVAPTESPIPKNSELYEDAQLLQAAKNQYESEQASASKSHTSSANRAYLSGYSSSAKNALSSQSQHHSQTYHSGTGAVDALNYGASDANSYSAGSSALNAYQSGARDSNSYAQNSYDANLAGNLQNSQMTDASVNSNNLLENVGSIPKSYHSSYSYHKSWERRGDPYIIKPASSDLTSQRLTSASTNQGNTCSYCMDNSQHRIRRSINKFDNKQEITLQDGTEDVGQQSINRWDQEQDQGQQTQSKWDELGTFNQQMQSQFGNLEDLGQQTQNQWDKLEDLGQKAQNQWGKLNDLSQKPQTQEQEDLGQQTQSQWGKLYEIGQQSQNKWNELGSFNQQLQSQLGNQEDLGQQAQNQWDKLENLGQQTQNQWDELGTFNQQQSQLGNQENLGQQTQNQWDKLENLGQQTQNQWDELGTFNQQQSQLGNQEDLGQQTQNQWDKLEDLGQKAQNHWGKLNDLSQKPQTQEHEEDLGQQTQSHWGKLDDLGQQTQNKWDELGSFNQQMQSQLGNQENLGQQTQNQWDKLENLGQQTQNQWNELGALNQQQSQLGNQENLGQQTQNHWDKLENLGQQTQNQWDELGAFNQQQSQLGNQENLGQQTQNHWDKLADLGQKAQNHWGKLNDLSQKSQTQDTEEDLGQSTQSHWGNQQTQSKPDDLENFAQQSHDKWNILDNLDQQQNLGQHAQSPKTFFVNNAQNTATNSYRRDHFVPHHTNSYQRWNCLNKDGTHVHHHKLDSLDETYLSGVLYHNLEHAWNPVQNTRDNTDIKPKYDISTPKETTTAKYVILKDNKPKTTLEIVTEVEDKNSVQINIDRTDIGRGDIGPEDIAIKPININDKNNNTTPEEIQSLSLTKAQKDISIETLNLSAINVNKQSKPNNKEKNSNDLTTVIESVINPINKAEEKSPKPDYLSSSIKPAFNDEQNENKEINTNNEQKEENILNHFAHTNWVKQTHNFDQQSIDKNLELFEDQNVESLLEPLDKQTGKQNVEQNLKYLGENEILQQFEKQHSAQHFQSLEEQNIRQETQNFEMQNSNQEKMVQPFLKQNMEQLETNKNNLDHLPTFDKKSSRQLDLPKEQTVSIISKEVYRQEQMPVNTKELESPQSTSKLFEISPEKINLHEQSIHPKNPNNISSPIEPTTEKPGFWNSLWHKTKSAKDSVVSWFHS